MYNIKGPVHSVVEGVRVCSVHLSAGSTPARPAIFSVAIPVTTVDYFIYPPSGNKTKGSGNNEKEDSEKNS